MYRPDRHYGALCIDAPSRLFAFEANINMHFHSAPIGASGCIVTFAPNGRGHAELEWRVCPP